ncbi:MAG: GtrA family protein [Prevotella sp.]
MGSLKDALLTFGKAQCSAWVASAIDFGVTLFCAHCLRVWYAYATFIGALSGGIANCAINYRWVFHAEGLKKKYVALRYFIVWGGSILFNTYGTYRLTELTGLNFILVKAAVAVAVAVLWNYQMQRTFVFHDNRNKQK